MNKNQVLCYTNHYKQSPFFDDTLMRLACDGYKTIVLLTGDPGEFHAPRVSHPNIYIVKAHHNSYDGGMMLFKTHNLLTQNPETKYLLHIDNDCYLSGTDELAEYLKEFEDGGYGYVGHLCNEATSKQYVSDSSVIYHVTNQQIFQRDPGGPPTPEPHYENAYQITLRSVYEPLSVEEVGHHRRFIAGLFQQGVKFGAHRANYIFNYSSYGQEWFHLGLIMNKYSALEQNQNLSQFNPESRFDLMRAGFFVAQEECYGRAIYSDFFAIKLEQFYNHMGGKDKCYAGWKENVRGTCMENWQKYQ